MAGLTPGRRALVALPLLARPARAQDWPARPIRIVVPFTPGGPVDLVARLMADRLRDRLGQPVLIDNRPGAGGNLGIRAVAQAAPDGTTFLLTSSSLAIGPALQGTQAVDPRTELTPISLVVEIATTITALPGRFADFPALLRAARERPGIVTYGSSGIGSSNHLSGALLCATAGINMVHVPYRGASLAMNAVLSREVDMAFASTVETIGAHRDGRARILAVTTPARIPALPDVPAAIEAVPGYVAPNWYAFAGPPGLPEAITRRMTAELARMRDDADFRTRLVAVGTEPLMSSPAELAQRLAREVPTWQRVAAEAGIRPD